MSSIKNCISLKDINSKTRQRSVLVRILRIWIQTDMKRNEGLEMILLDKEGDKIQASVSPALKTKMMPMLKEGGLTLITNFQVGNNTPQYQNAKINHEFKISFSALTKVAEYTEYVDIDENGFVFILFKDVFMHDKAYFLDIIAEIKERHDIKIVETKNREKSRLCDIDLEDDDGAEMTCTLWEGYVDQLKEFYDNRPVGSVEPVRVVLQFVLKTEFRGKPKVTTMKHATRFFINPDISQIKQFILSRGLSSSVGGVTSTNTGISSGSRPINLEEWINPDYIKTIDEIVSTDEFGTYIVKAKMVDLHPEKSWYYEACGNTNCFSGVDAKSKVCKKNHTSSSTVLRYKMLIEVTDGSDYTYFTFFDNWALYFLHKSVSELIKECEKAGDKNGIPDTITDLLSLEKECLFRVEVSERFTDRIYTVKRLTEDKETIARFTSMPCVDEAVSKDKVPEKAVNVDDLDEDKIESAEGSSSNSNGNAITPLKRLHNDDFSSTDLESVDLQFSSSKIMKDK